MFKNARTLLLKGTPVALDEALKVLRMVDTAPRQMVIEAKVVDTSPDYTKNLGVEWNWNQFQFFERGQQITGGSGTSSGSTPTGPLGFGSYLRAPFNPIATLNAMITSRQAKLLATPQTAVLDDQDASVFIGDTLRFQSLAQSSPTTGNQFTVVEVPVGIILLVHPRVNDDGYITLRVHPVVSTVTGFTAGLPQTSSREAETVVRVKDGDTLVIAGLIRDEDIRQMSKIPLLGDLPLIGNLFKNEMRNHRRSEVMVFLTIRLIPQPND
jgi:type II secretory pathway component GspD/PulD (secretin)